MSNTNNDYGIKDIQSLSFKEGVRLRIQAYLGSDDLEGTYQALKEIINNSTDEALNGYGNLIQIAVDEQTNLVTVRDYGRGVPFGKREDGENVLVSIYTKSHTGGKFDDKAYKNSSGLNGLGGSCVCLSSLNFKVHSYRDGTEAYAEFAQGDLQQYKERKTKEKNGTLVEFIPDPAVFKNGAIGYSYSRICEDIKNISYLYNGITFEVKNLITKETSKYCAKNGIVDFVKDNLSTPMHKHILYKQATDGIDKVEIAFQWGSKGEKSYVFVNGLMCPEGGTPITGAKSAITRGFKGAGTREFNGDAIRANLFYVINCSVTAPSFANQTKTKINNANLRTLASQAFTEALRDMRIVYADEFNTIVEYLNKITRAEAAAERARKQVLEATRDIEKNQKRKVFSSDKLKDAEYLGQDSTLLLVEGNSAASSMAVARDVKHYGILALRGKPINPFTNPIDKVYENEEIKLLLSAMNIVPGKYDPKKLRYGRIGICSDADRL